MRVKFHAKENSRALDGVQTHNLPEALLTVPRRYSDSMYWCVSFGESFKQFYVFSIPGYYCTLQASVSNPTDGTTGNICPMGHYCPEGSAMAIACDSGYFLNVTGSDDIGDCIICTGGWYCPGTGNDEPVGTCDPGYYCPTGQNDSAPADYK